jgi:Holliday junction resolvase
MQIIKMSQKSESRLWKLLRENVTDVHWTRIESWVSPGVPDVNGCASFGEFWIELKVAKNNKVTLSPHQISWLLSRCRVGGNAFVLTKEGRRGPLFLFSGLQAKELATSSILEIEPMVKIEAPYDWDLLLKTIALSCQ